MPSASTAAPASPPIEVRREAVPAAIPAAHVRSSSRSAKRGIRRTESVVRRITHAEPDPRPASIPSANAAS